MRAAAFALFAALLAVAGAADAQPRTPLPCPGPLLPLVLATGRWQLVGPCSVDGIHLSGDADVLVTGPRFLVQDDVLLDGDAVLEVATAELVIAQYSTAEIDHTIRDRALLVVRNARVVTNATSHSAVTAFFESWDDARVRFIGCGLDTRYNWMLAYAHDRSTLQVHDSVDAPTETYPRDASTVQVSGANTRTRVVLLIPPQASAELGDLPTGDTFTYQFGRGTAGNAGIDYLVQVFESWARWGVSSGPDSDVTIRDNGQPVTLSFLFARVTEPTWVAGLRPNGPLVQRFTQQGRLLDLDDALLYGNGWQIYVESLIDAALVRPVAIEDAQVNELGALRNGVVEVREAIFQYAYLAAYQPGSRVRVEDSVINSQNVRANADGVMEIADSTIWGSLLDAGGSARIRLSNTELNENVCHPGCLPQCISFLGANTCNGFNPRSTVGFAVRDAAAVVAARLAPIAAPVPAGAPLSLVGDAFVESPVASLAASPWELSVRPLAGGAATIVATGGGAPRRGVELGVVDAAALAPGEWVARLEVRPPGETPVVAERHFRVLSP